MSLSEQARCFLASLLLGFILSLLYDLLRAVRLRRATKRRFTSALDLLYCAAFTLLTFLFALRIGGGELRLYMLCSALFGAVSYFTLCAWLFRPLWAFWAEVLFSFARLAAAPLRWLQKVYGKLAKLCKRYFLFSRNRLIIKSYERRARYSLRRARKKEAHRHGRAGQKGKKRTSFLTMLVIAILIALVGVQLIHLRSQIDDARSQLTALQSDLDTAKQENDALSSALEKADDPEFLQELARDQLGYVTPGEKTFYDVSN